VLERDIRVSMSHKPGNDVNRGAGLEQFGRDSMPEAVDANVGATAPWPRAGTHKIYFVLASAVCQSYRFALRRLKFPSNAASKCLAQSMINKSLKRRTKRC
jgi:hypothetical protein